MKETIFIVVDTCVSRGQALKSVKRHRELLRGHNLEGSVYSYQAYTLGNPNPFIVVIEFVDENSLKAFQNVI